MKETNHQGGKKKSDSKYSAASMVGEIEDLLTNILLRLPAKSLMRFKCVSKQWLSLISSSQFGISHTRFHQLVNSIPSAILLVNGFKVADELRVLPLKLSGRSRGSVPSFDFVKVNRLQIIQSCNGMILCRSTHKITGEDNYAIRGFVYWIYNPTTAQSKRLSFPGTLKELSRINFLISVGLAFDPISSPYYKIVFIFDLPKKGLQSFLVEIYVYSSENDSWNSQIVDVIGMSMGHVLPPTLAIGFQDGVFCKNGIHWFRNGAGKSLLCFPFDDWTMKKMHLPMELNVRYFGESEGNLHVLAYHSFGSYHGSNFQVLDIAPDYSRWVVKYNVNFEYIKKEFPGGLFSILSIILAKNEQPVIILSVGGKLMSYNLNERTFKTIYEIGWRPELDRRKLDYEGEYYKHFENLICI